MDQPSLVDAEAKLRRAEKHLNELRTVLRVLRESQPYRVTVDRDRTAHIVRIEPEEPPADISAVVGDVVSNLRGALDYLVYMVAWLDSGHPQEGTQFPITDTPEKFEDAIKGRFKRLKGVSPEHVAAFERLQPYNGGGWLELLRDFSNRDKHMQLVLVSPQSRGAVSIRDDATADIERGDPNVLEVHVDFDLSLQVAFGQDGPPVVATLEVLHTEICAAVDLFKPLF